MSGFLHDQPDFEQWLLLEIQAKAWHVRLHEGRNQDNHTSWMVASHLDMLLITLGRYADRDPSALRKVAHDGELLRKLVREGPSMAAEARRIAKKAMSASSKKPENDMNYTCRGCDGTCCTGVGSDPCTCPPPSGTGEDDD